MFVDPLAMGKAQRSANHKHSPSVDSIERSGFLEAKGTEIARDPRTSQRSKVANSPAIIRGSMAKVVTAGAGLPRMIVSHHQHG